MALDKQDLKEIKKILDDTIEKSEATMSDKIEYSTEKSEMGIEARIKESEERIIERINQEVSDLAENDLRIMQKLDKIDNHEKRIVKIEKKLGMTV